MGLDTSGMVIPHQLLHGSSSNAEIHGGTSRDKLNEYTLKRKRSRNIIFNIRNSWYYNIEYMEAQVGLNCSGHALKALLHPYVDRFSPAWNEVQNERSLQPLSGSFFWHATHSVRKVWLIENSKGRSISASSCARFSSRFRLNSS